MARFIPHPARITAAGMPGKSMEEFISQAVIVPAGEWVQYATPSPVGAGYVAVCVPAFSPETVHRDG